jgi:hypothetical protein
MGGGTTGTDAGAPSRARATAIAHDPRMAAGGPGRPPEQDRAARPPAGPGRRP